MSATTSLESLREVLAGEHSQLESWVSESFAAMEALHGELSDWQRELTRQQALLDQREAALADAAQASESEAIVRLREELAAARNETRQLEEENGEQLQALEELHKDLAVAKTELRAAHKHAEELKASLDAERQRGEEQQHTFTTELRELRRMIERQGALLERLTDAAHDESHVNAGDAENETPDAGDRAAELLRRASTRRAQRRPT